MDNKANLNKKILKKIEAGKAELTTGDCVYVPTNL